MIRNYGYGIEGTDKGVNLFDQNLGRMKINERLKKGNIEEK